MSGRLKKNIIYLTLLQFFNYAAPLILVPYLIIGLGAEKYGVIAIVLGLTQFSYIITEFGFAQSATAKIAENVNDEKLISIINGSVLILKLILSVCCSIASSIFILYQGYGDIYTIISVIVIIVFQALQPIWFFNGIEDMGKITFFTLLSKCLYFMFAIIGLMFVKNINIVIHSLAASTVIGTLISYILFYRTNYSISIPKFSFLHEEFKYSRQFFWARGAVSLYTSLCTIIVGIAGGGQAAAIFSVCEQVYKAGKSLTSPLCQALYPYLIRTKDWHLFFRFCIITTVIMFCGCIFVMLASSFILNNIFQIKSAEAVVTLKVLSMSVFVSFLGVYFGHLALVPLNKIRAANNSVLIGALFFVLTNSVLYIFNKITPITMSIVIISTEIIITSIRIFIFSKSYRSEQDINA